MRHELAAARRTLGGRTCGGSWRTIISCGTLAAVLIPEFTKVFTSSHSKHVHEIVTASREGGASLTILSGLVAGNFWCFWKGMLIAGLMARRLLIVSMQGLDASYMAPRGRSSRFGLVAFGFLVHGAGQHRRR